MAKGVVVQGSVWKAQLYQACDGRARGAMADDSDLFGPTTYLIVDLMDNRMIGGVISEKAKLLVP